MIKICKGKNNKFHINIQILIIYKQKSNFFKELNKFNLIKKLFNEIILYILVKNY